MRYSEAEKKAANAVMTRVYGYMFLGLIVSALTAAMFAYVPDCREFLYSVGKTGETTLSVSGWIVLLAPLAIVLFTGGLMKQLSAGAMMIVFVFFCALMGASLSSVFLVYTEASIMMCFVTASATFGAMALFGLTTQTDLTSWGSGFAEGFVRPDRCHGGQHLLQIRRNGLCHFAGCRCRVLCPDGL